MKKCVVTFCTEKGWYAKGQARLLESLKVTGFDGDVLCWQGEESLKCPTHAEVPYAFKTYALMEAYKRGYQLVLWLDSSIWAVKSVEPVFIHLQQHHYLMQANGFNAGEWCSDAALQTLQVTREESFAIPSCLAGGLGLDLGDARALKFLELWHEKAQDGITFKGAWSNQNGEVSCNPKVLGHRHDQAAASIIAYQLGMQLQPGGLYIAYYNEEYGKEVCLLIRGMGGRGRRPGS